MTNEEKEAYKCYLDRLSAPMHPVVLPKEECEAYNGRNLLPGQKELENILKEAGAM